ncbi:MAG: SLBB domain-containing protein [Gemmatimonadota bacterium]
MIFSCLSARHTRYLILLLLSAVGLWTPALLSAQISQQDTAQLRRMAEQRLGTSVSQEELLRRLQASGMTRSQVQARLQQLGYDPRLADEYFDALDSGRELDPTGTPSEELVQGLRGIGVLLRSPLDTLGIMLDSIRADSAVRAAERSRIFGKTLFARATGQFEPVITGAVGPDYRIGPGDEIWLILTGDVEQSYPLDVTREGFLIIPQVGQVPVNGLTIEQLEDRLYTYLGRAYSGVRRGPDATTRFQVSLGQLRTSHVFVVGEVERPSGYQISPMGRVFNALYQAGGPNETGSFRRILVRRNGRVVGEVDLYPYLLAGEEAQDIRLEQGDMVFVPVAETRVTLEGEARRTGIYELKPGEGLRDALSFAGGVRPEAVLERVQIDRILPPHRREPGRDRELVDVDVSSLLMLDAPVIPLNDGDIITLFTVSEERRNRVAVTGGVRRPGQYEYRPGMTLADLVARADGLDEGAYTHRALVYRLEQDRSRTMLRASLEGAQPAALVLADRDSVVVLREDSLRLPSMVTIQGYVRDPGQYQLAANMSLRDLVLAAGGFAEGADPTAAEVARTVDPMSRTDQTAEVVQVPLAADAALPFDGVPRWQPEAGEFVLLRGDRVFIRRAPGYEEARTVAVTGQVLQPGRYELGTRQARISDVIQRAGGLTAEAYPDGFAIYRDGLIVAGNLTAALANPTAPGNILLLAGDSLHIPRYDATVNVTGAVLLQAKVLYDDDRSLGDYIDRAGGYAENADRNGVVVTYPNGERKVVRRTVWLRRVPTVEPGSTIFVPSQSESELEGVNWGEVIARSTAVISALATLYIATR